MEQHNFKNVNNCLNTSLYYYLETSGGESIYLYLNVVHFFQHQCKLDICGSKRLFFLALVPKMCSSIGIQSPRIVTSHNVTGNPKAEVKLLRL